MWQSAIRAREMECVVLVVGLDARSPLRGSKLAHGLEACLKGIVLIYQLENFPLHDACSFERN